MRDGNRPKILATPDSTVPLYTFHIPFLTLNKPSLTLYGGNSTAGPALGSCRISPFSARINIELALGDPKNSSGGGGSAVASEALQYELRPKWNGEYKMSVELPRGSGQQRELMWKATRDVDETFKRLMGRHMKLVDTATGDVIARFIDATVNWSTRGVVEFWQDFGEDGGKEWEKVVLLSVLALLEAKKRKSSAAAAAG